MIAHHTTTIDGIVGHPPKAPIRTTHPRLGAVQLHVDVVPDDPDLQVVHTIQRMRQYAREDCSKAAVQAATRDAMSLGPGAIEHRIWRYVQSRCTFSLDHHTASPFRRMLWQPVVEILIRPQHMLHWRLGDCDDYSMLVAAMLLTAKVACHFVCVAGDPATPQTFSHVYVTTYRPVHGRTNRIPIDASHGPWCGWEANTTRRKEWAV